MKKFIVYFFCFFFLPWHSFAQGNFVDEVTARTVAENFYLSRITERNNIDPANSGTVSSFIISQEDQPLYYAFNMPGGGFVAVSASDATIPVLCYSFTGEYSNGGQPANFSAWMKQYERQISHVMSTKAEPSAEITALWKYYSEKQAATIGRFSGREVLPMLHSTWDQGTYYNELCPADPGGPGGHCVTGCVATAMGQLLNYFRWPDTGTGSYSYECPPYGTLSVNYDTARYEWNIMENSLSHSNREVAELLYHLGVSVDMVYGPDGSGMYNHKAAYSLKTYFKYSPETQYLFRDTTTMNWDSILVAHLDRKIPMYYAGWSVPDTNGHAFICDGYQGEDYFHFNWGWSGSYDGYFYTDELTPGGSLFNLAQELIINAVPDTLTYGYPAYCEEETEFTALFGTIEDGSGPLFDYQDGSGCSWLIAPADSINHITLSFLEFDTDPEDSVVVYDGDNPSAPILGSFSGAEIPGDMTTTGHVMLVTFTSDMSETGDGFMAEFSSEIPLFCNGLELMTDQTGFLSDGSGNWNYHNNSACLWRIMPEGANSVSLHFTEFDTEAGYDLLKVYDLQTQQLLAEYSGSYAPAVPDPVTSPSGKMFVAFSSNYSGTASGWRAYYESDLVGVKENEENPGLIIFPNPSDGMVNLSFKEPEVVEVKIFITDLSGRIVHTDSFNELNSNPLTIDLEQLSPGIYILSAISRNNSPENHKILIR